MTKFRIGSLVVLMAALIGASGWATGDGEQTTGEAPTVEWLGFYEFNPNATEETGVPVWIGEATNTVVKPVHVGREDFETKWNTMAASGDFPDIVQLLGPNALNQVYQLGPAGQFVNVSQAMADGKMPNLKRLSESAADEGFELFNAPDGNAYVSTYWNNDFIPPRTPGFVLRGDLLEKAGYDTSNPRLFETTDDVLQALIRSKPHFDALFGEPTFGVYNRGERGIRNSGQLPRALLSTEFGTDTIMRFAEDNTYELGALSPRYKAGIAFLRGLFEARILHPDWLIMSEEDQRAGFGTGKSMFCWGDWLCRIEPGWFERIATGNDAYAAAVSYEVVQPKVLGETIRLRPPRRSRPRSAINARSRDVDAAIRVVDFMYSEQGAELARMGKEGVMWERDNTPGNEWGRRWLRCWSGQYPKERCEEIGSKDARGDLVGENPFLHMLYPLENSYLDWSHFYMDPADPDGTKALRANQVATWRQWERQYRLTAGSTEPGLQFTPDEDDERQQLEAAIYTFIEEQLPRFVHGQNNMTSDWSAFISRVNELGAERLVAIYNAALQRAVRDEGLALEPVR